MPRLTPNRMMAAECVIATFGLDSFSSARPESPIALLLKAIAKAKILNLFG